MSQPSSHPSFVGAYQLLHRIASGGMGQVYLGRRPTHPGELVAVKVLTESFDQDSRFVEMLMTEAAACASLRHPNIVGLLDFGESDGRHFIVMEYIPGQNLREVLHRQTARADVAPMPLRVACSMFVDAAKAMAHMHGTGRSGSPVIHRDISPANLMLGDDGQLKIIDLGVARGENGNATTPGVLKGKFAYMAPEYVSCNEYDHRVDIWSFGVVMFEFLGRRRLFRGDTSAQVLAQVLGAVIPRLDALITVPPRLADTLAKALARDPAARYGSALEMAADLASVVASLPIDPQIRTAQAWMAASFGAEASERRKLRETMLQIDPDTSVELKLTPVDADVSVSQTPTSSARRRNQVFSGSDSPLMRSPAPEARAMPPTVAGYPLLPASMPAPAVAQSRRGARWLPAILLLLAALAVIGVIGVAVALKTTDRKREPTAVAGGPNVACEYREAGLTEIEAGNCKRAGELFNRALKERCEADDLIELYKMSLALCDKVEDRPDPSRPTPAPIRIAKLLITSSPKGAAIEVDGQASGITPSTSEVPFGVHEVRLTGQTGEVYEEEVNVDRAQNLSINHAFAPPTVAAAVPQRSAPSPLRRRPPPPPRVTSATSPPEQVIPAPNRPPDLVAPTPDRSPPTTPAPDAGTASVTRVPTTTPTAPDAGAGTPAIATRVPPPIPTAAPIATSAIARPAATTADARPATGGLTVDAKNVSGGEIFVNGVRRGREPMTIKDLPAGVADVEVRIGGRVVKKQSIYIKSNIIRKWSPL